MKPESTTPPPPPATGVRPREDDDGGPSRKRARKGKDRKSAEPSGSSDPDESVRTASDTHCPSYSLSSAYLALALAFGEPPLLIPLETAHQSIDKATI